jgi:hypothetical protein
MKVIKSDLVSPIDNSILSARGYQMSDWQILIDSIQI